MSSSTSNPADIVVKQHAKLPDSWCWQELDSLSVFINGDRGKNYPSRNVLVNDGIPFINAGHLSKGLIDFSDMNFITEDRFNLLNSGKVAPDDILFCLRGSLGKSALVNIPRGAIASSLVIIRVVNVIVPKYILYFLASPLGFSFVQAFDNGTAQPNLSAKSVRSFKVPLSPRPEQHRIVKAIESYLTRLDDAVASLERVKANLEKYRASVLKAAVEGRLVPTEADLARQEERTYEPASELLRRILAERKLRWIDAETERARARAEAGARKKGKPWTNVEDEKALEQGRVKAEKKYKEPAPPDTNGLPELPEGWCWVSIDSLSHEVRYGSSSKTSESQENEVPVLRMGNILNGNLDFTNLKYLPSNHNEFPDLLLKPKDLLFNRTNSAELVGKTAVYKGQVQPCSFASYLIRVRFCGGIESSYVSGCLNSVLGRRWIRSVVSQQVGQANVNGTKLKAFCIPLPPRYEQRRIVEKIEEAESVIDFLGKESSRDIKQCDQLRQSILKWAFEGKLVDQDPSDELASVLLERIKDERDAAFTKQRTGGGARRRRKKKPGAVRKGKVE